MHAGVMFLNPLRGILYCLQRLSGSGEAGAEGRLRIDTAGGTHNAGDGSTAQGGVEENSIFSIRQHQNRCLRKRLLGLDSIVFLMLSPATTHPQQAVTVP